MNIKRFWLTLPIILFPYAFAGFFAAMWFSSGSEGPMMFFYENMFLFLAVIGVLMILAIVCAIICLVLGLSGKWDSLSLAKTAMIIKLIHIPAYVVIFIWGFIFFITIWLMIFTVVLAIIDYIILLTSTSLSLTAAINSAREGKCSIKSNIWFIILQFIFCADVVAAVIFYFKLRKKNRLSEVGSDA